ncbi:MAG: hypothetical protein JW697_04675 [Kosmotogaceae bacterium]|nr:hypothetical protein [Kosmotogaceae bacterium]
MTKRVDLRRIIGETNNHTPSPRQPFLTSGHPGGLLARISVFRAKNGTLGADPAQEHCGMTK